MKILITGGHFSPAYSLIKEFNKRGDIVSIAGRKYTFEGDNTKSLEYEISKKDKISFYEIRTGRLQRKFSIHTIPSVFKIIRGLIDSYRAISACSPDIVLTFGGYISFPVVLVSFLKRVPVVLHEQTPRAGLASRILARFAQKICISFESSRGYFPVEKTIFTGNPIRQEIFEIGSKPFELAKGPVIYITGGSSGSHFINNLIHQNIEKLVKDFVVIHQSGDNDTYDDYAALEEKRKSLDEGLKKSYILRKFIYPNEIGYVFNKADIVVSRSGINTVIELLALGKPCFLIPLAHGQSGEQLYNAKLVSETGLGEYAEERYLSANKFLEVITAMFKNIKKYKERERYAKEYVVTDAAERIIKVVDDLYEKKKVRQ